MFIILSVVVIFFSFWICASFGNVGGWALITKLSKLSINILEFQIGLILG